MKNPFSKQLLLAVAYLFLMGQLSPNGLLTPGAYADDFNTSGLPQLVPTIPALNPIAAQPVVAQSNPLHDQGLHDYVLDPATGLFRTQDATLVLQNGTYTLSGLASLIQDGAKLVVDSTAVLLVDCVLSTYIKWLRVNGTLKFATDRNTGLYVGTIAGDKTAILEIGTAADPVHQNVSATITFADKGPIDTSWDPLQMSGGMIWHGQADIHGAATTAYADPIVDPMAGDNVLRLASLPTNWKAGDELVFAGTDPYNPLAGIDQVTIAGIQTAADGTIEVILSSNLRYAHKLLLPNMTLPVANLTRNVVFKSENKAVIASRGHVMFMHTNKVTVKNAGFYGLGRTNKRMPTNSAELDSNGALVAGTGTNTIGRYSFHIHEGGSTGLAVVEGCVVDGSPGLGFVNHSSNVNFVKNVAFNAAGAGFLTELGNEMGSFEGNFAIGMIGQSPYDLWGNPLPGDPSFASAINNGAEINPGVNGGNNGISGAGFWLTGVYVTVKGNIAANVKDGGLVYFPKELLDKDGKSINKNSFPISFLPTNLQTLALQLNGGSPYLDPWLVAPLEFSGNKTAYSGIGASFWGIRPGTAKHELVGLNHEAYFSDFSAYGCLSGIFIGRFVAQGISSLVFDRFSLIRGIDLKQLSVKRDIGVNKVAAYSKNIHMRNSLISGFALAAKVPDQGGGYSSFIGNTIVDYLIAFLFGGIENHQIQRVDFFDNIFRSSLSSHDEFVMANPGLNLNEKTGPNSRRDPFNYFTPKTFRFRYSPGAPIQQLYVNAQNPNSPIDPVLAAFLGLPASMTVLEFYNLYGLAPDGALAAGNVTWGAGPGGIRVRGGGIGSITTQAAQVYASFGTTQITNQLQGTFTVSLFDSAANKLLRQFKTQQVNLKEGFNMVPILDPVTGKIIAYAPLWGDTAPPKDFTPTPNDLKVAAADVSRLISGALTKTVSGTIYDTIGAMADQINAGWWTVFNWRWGTDGKLYGDVTVKDRAGNRLTKTLVFQIV